MKKTIFYAMAAACAMLALAAQPVICQTTSIDIQNYRIDAYEASVSLNMIILHPDVMPASIQTADFSVETNKIKRSVEKAFRCDSKGTQDSNGGYIGLELAYSRGGSPMAYNGRTNRNDWVQEYPVKVTYKDISCTTDKFRTDFLSACDNWTFSTSNGMSTAAYQPESLKTDKAKNPLVIWLHGMGEGGTDARIVLMGNEAVALAQEPIQSHFTSRRGANGAYVLAVQSPTMWMDAGNGRMTQGDAESIYLERLKAAIDEYVASNPDVDRKRIYVGGCSNGGYMTMNLLIHYPGFFAAGYPVCQAYADANISDAEIKSLAKENIWFVQSFDDTTVRPAQFGIPTFKRLVQAGAKNVWSSMFENVRGTDMPGARYMGHFSWVYVFNDQVTGSQAQSVADMIPTNNGGGTVSPQGFSNLFDWMNAQ